MELLIGVDGGGSKTRALAAGADLVVRGEAETGSSNLQVVGLDGAGAAVAAAVEGALAAAGAPGTRPAAVCLALAGAGRPAQRAVLAGWAAAHFAGLPVALVSDLEPVLAAGTPAGWGVALVAGTGSSCLARAPGGEPVRVGGWGYLLGDEGSGYDLARRALRLATQTADGRAEAHGVLRAALDHYGLAEPDGLVARVYGRDSAPTAIASLARPVLALAAAGDAHARALLDESATALALIATTAARRVGLARAPVALAGGLFGAGGGLRERVAGLLAPALAPARYVADPARGTLVLARRLWRKGEG